MSCLAYVSVCTSCGTERVRWVTRHGESLTPRYDWPEGYSQRGEEVKLSSVDWRRTFVAADYKRLDTQLAKAGAA